MNRRGLVPVARSQGLRALLLATLSLGGASGASPGSLVITLPGRVEVVRFHELGGLQASMLVRGCEVDLASRLQGMDAPGIKEISVTGLGGGAWHVLALLADRNLELVVENDPRRLVLSTRWRETAQPAPRGAPPTLSALLAGSEEAAPRRALELPIVFLHGDALASAMEPSTWPFPTPVALTHDGGEVNWETVDHLRRQLEQERAEKQRARLFYRLAMAHLELDHVREAAYYLTQIPQRASPLPPGSLSAHRAWAAIRGGRWDDARALLSSAHRRGAPPAEVAELLALVSLATGDPPHLPMASALADLCHQPQARLLAAELMQRGGEYEASLALLDCDSALPAELGPTCALRRADALLVTGDLAGVRKELREAPADLAKARHALMDLLERRPKAWPAMGPPLGRLAGEGGRVRAEALYIRMQIQAMLHESDGAMEDLRSIIRHHPEIFARSDGIEWLWLLYAQRLKALRAVDRPVELVTFHEETWRRELLDSVDDYGPLVMVADAYESLGLPDSARRTLKDAFYIIRRTDTRDPELVLRLARLYATTGRHQEAMETLAFLDALRPPPEITGERLLLTARIRRDTGDHDGARRAFRGAARLQVSRRQATLELGTWEASMGNCEAAIPLLEGSLSTEGEDPLPYLALARCQARRGQAGEASARARQAAGRSATERSGRLSAFMAAMDDGTAMEWEAVMGGEDIWAELGREELESTIFQQELAELLQRAKGP